MALSHKPAFRTTPNMRKVRPVVRLINLWKHVSESAKATGSSVRAGRRAARCFTCWWRSALGEPSQLVVCVHVQSLKSREYPCLCAGTRQTRKEELQKAMSSKSTPTLHYFHTICMCRLYVVNCEETDALRPFACGTCAAMSSLSVNATCDPLVPFSCLLACTCNCSTNLKS